MGCGKVATGSVDDAAIGALASNSGCAADRSAKGYAAGGLPVDPAVAAKGRAARFDLAGESSTMKGSSSDGVNELTSRDC